MKSFVSVYFFFCFVGGCLRCYWLEILHWFLTSFGSSIQTQGKKPGREVGSLSRWSRNDTWMWVCTPSWAVGDRKGSRTIKFTHLFLEDRRANGAADLQIHFSKCFYSALFCWVWSSFAPSMYVFGDINTST